MSAVTIDLTVTVDADALTGVLAAVADAFLGEDPEHPRPGPEPEPEPKPDDEPDPLEGIRVGDHLRCVKAVETVYPGVFSIDDGKPVVECDDCGSRHYLDRGTFAAIEVVHEPIGQTRVSPDGKRAAIRVGAGWWMPSTGEFVGDEIAEWTVTFDPAKP